MEQVPPPPLTRRDLRPLYEAFSEEDDEDGNMIFLFSSFGYITQDHRAYFWAEQEDIRTSLKLLCDDDVYPHAPANVTVVTEPVGNDIYLKRPPLNVVYLDTSLLPVLTLNETRILEKLKACSHTNIVPYLGCIVRRDRIVSLAFKRLSATLFQRVGASHAPFNAASCMESTESVVRHLHSLGLAHNDLNPGNIMVDENDEVYVIDFGSCREVGQGLITAGTRGWIYEEFTTSESCHDLIALDKIRAWLGEETSCSVDQQQVNLAPTL
ncbi:Serine/threonine-protein kinase SMU1 [Sphaceloma murrayae]|uniref:Serine/threonine-protein kinase SMU1 n=1 Tax=Sphaceloma murrayae TaxID=2082308 RepID=A0A2K1QRV4_9PEZI|nr:Serine/threonine-protein kinase SMU1 [Sphaceloma murrayae]